MPDVTVYFWLLLIASIVAMLGQRLRVPYALALVITGLVIGLPRLLPQAHLDPHILFTILLPPLLFEAAINLRLEQLKAHWRPIALYALGGTVLSALIVGLLAAWLLHLPLLVALVFGALIAPTDPISVMAIFKRLGVDKRLSMLVEGESLFNDGIAVVLFTVLVGAVTQGTFSIGTSLLQFVVTILGGAAVGVGIGLLASRVTRAFDDHLLEIMLTTIVAFGAYLSAESFHVSGVIAVVAAGLAVGNYGMRTGMSPTTRLAVSSFWEYSAFVANSIVFLLIGIDEANLLSFWRSGWLILGTIVIVLVGRAVAVYGLAPLANRLERGITFHWQHVLFWGGLRGALSMALALGLSLQFPHRDMLVAMTFSVVLFSLLVQGLSIGAVLKWFGLVSSQSNTRYQHVIGQLLATRAALNELQQLQNNHLFPATAVSAVEEDYHIRQLQLETDIENLMTEDPSLVIRHTTEIRRLALLAEKSAILDAERAGLLSEEEYNALATAIDESLDRKSATPPIDNATS